MGELMEGHLRDEIASLYRQREALRAELGAAYAVIRRYNAGWAPHVRGGLTEWVKTAPYEYTAGDIHEPRFDTAVEPMIVAEANAIRRARATEETSGHE